MPGRALTGTGLLDEQMIVIQPHHRSVHQLRRRGGRGGPEDQIAIFGNALPVAKILKEKTRIVDRARNLGVGARRGEVALDAARGELKFLRREKSANAHGAVARERRLILRRYRMVGVCHERSPSGELAS